MAECAICACFNVIASFGDYDSIVSLSGVSRSVRSNLRYLVRVGDPTTSRPLDAVTRLTPFLKEIRLYSIRDPVTVNETLTSLTLANSTIGERLATCVPQLRELVLANVRRMSVSRFWEVRTVHLERTHLGVDVGVLFPRLERLFVTNCPYYRATKIHTERLELLFVSDSSVSGWVTRIGTLVCRSGGTTLLTTREIGLCVVTDKKLSLSSNMPKIIDCLVTLHPKLSNPGYEWNTLVTRNHQLYIPLDTRPSERHTTRLVVMRINRSTRRKINVVLHCENSVLILDTGPKTVIAGMDLQGVQKVIFLGVNTPLEVPAGIRLINDEDDPHLRRYREIQERIAPYDKL